MAENIEELGQFGVIYADPPWTYSDLGHSRRVDRIYPLLSLKDICALPIPTISLPNAVLFLWTTSPMLLLEAPAVIKSWGFSYKASCVWDKELIGMGHYWRIQHEMLLLAVKGRPPLPTPASRMPSVLRARRGKHSVKPIQVYGMIETMYPTLNKIELFARSRRDGWTSWGNDIAPTQLIIGD